MKDKAGYSHSLATIGDVLDIANLTDRDVVLSDNISYSEYKTKNKLHNDGQPNEIYFYRSVYNCIRIGELYTNFPLQVKITINASYHLKKNKIGNEYYDGNLGISQYQYIDVGFTTNKTDTSPHKVQTISIGSDSTSPVIKELTFNSLEDGIDNYLFIVPSNTKGYLKRNYIYLNSFPPSFDFSSVFDNTQNYIKLDCSVETKQELRYVIPEETNKLIKYCDLSKYECKLKTPVPSLIDYVSNQCVEYYDIKAKFIPEIVYTYVEFEEYENILNINEISGVYGFDILQNSMSDTSYGYNGTITEFDASGFSCNFNYLNDVSDDDTDVDICFLLLTSESDVISIPNRSESMDLVFEETEINDLIKMIVNGKIGNKETDRRLDFTYQIYSLNFIVYYKNDNNEPVYYWSQEISVDCDGNKGKFELNTPGETSELIFPNSRYSHVCEETSFSIGVNELLNQGIREIYLAVGLSDFFNNNNSLHGISICNQNTILEFSLKTYFNKKLKYRFT